MADTEYERPENDHLTDDFAALVPEEYRCTDRFLDLVAWNIRYFSDKDSTRVEKVAQIMNAINADVFVLEEIREGSLEIVIDKLRDLGAGNYTAAYGTTGGDQRVAIMYDLDWLRAKDDIQEVFAKKETVTPDGKDVFPRLPLLGVFVCLSHYTDPFDFQLVGLHLKSQRGGGDLQRLLAAQKLTYWLDVEAPKVDADVIMTGDYNEPPTAKAWESFRELEKNGKAVFTSLNDKNEISHLMYRNKKEIGTRLDLSCVTIAASEKLAEKKSQIIRWTSLDGLLASSPDAKKIKTYIKDISDNVSDHMPVVTRFYFTEEQN